MCGIVAYLGQRDATPILTEGLKRLEYRGYDSAGIAVVKDKALVVRRSVGRISALEEKLDGELDGAQVGMAHTRWATHGAPSEGPLIIGIGPQRVRDRLRCCRHPRTHLAGDLYGGQRDRPHHHPKVSAPPRSMPCRLPRTSRRSSGRSIRSSSAGTSTSWKRRSSSSRTVLQTCMRGRVDLREGGIHLGGIADCARELVRARRIILTGCGTAWHAALVGEYLFEDLPAFRPRRSTPASSAIATRSSTMARSWSWFRKVVRRPTRWPPCTKPSSAERPCWAW
jgi:hypothetical protein